MVKEKGYIYFTVKILFISSNFVACNANTL